MTAKSPLGAAAVLILELWRCKSHGGLLVLAGSEFRAERLGAILHALAPDSKPMVLPAWDALPYDGLRPSRQVSGRRASVLRRLSAEPDRPLVLAAADAALQRVPAPGAWTSAGLPLYPGQKLSTSQLEQFFERAGYALDARVDEPGEYSIQGQAIDVFPAGALGPIRIGYDEDVITALSHYDPVTQRTNSDIAELVLDLMDESLVTAGKLSGQGGGSAKGGHAACLFDYLPHAALLVDEGVEVRATAWLEQVWEAYQSSRAVPALRTTDAQHASPDKLYLSLDEWRSHLSRREVTRLADSNAGVETTIPRFCAEPVPGRALRAFVEAQRARGHRIILAASHDAELNILEQRARRSGLKHIEQASSWNDAVAGSDDAAASLKVDLDTGFQIPSRRIVVIAAPDVLGSSIAPDMPFSSREPSGGFNDALRFGDTVIHLERGAGILRGLEAVSNSGTPDAEMIRLGFTGADVLSPVEELAVVWKYASEDSIATDRADGTSWSKRRAELEAALAQTAQKLVASSRARAQTVAPKLVPPPADYERFVARFRFFPTPDQARASAEVLADLASGQPMNRIVCGDVGYGKTEVAMRAAAAAILSGKQVALAVPTTILARQHFEAFTKRFGGMGIGIGHLSRLVPAAERRAVSKGLSDGSIRLLIGTHAIAGRTIRFKDLGLVILDEEHRFGARDKAKLHALGRNAHLLMLTATPIPRTLQLAMTGLKSVSVLANPPARRLRIRTILSSYDAETIRAALTHEQRRGGQSFIVCPRIEDLEPWQSRLQQLVPELQCRVLHAKLPAAEIDDAMLAFANGDGDVLLATNIIESGLDLPRANTILIWRTDRFGLAQLHQLRGRVGRGARRGYAYLLTDPSTKIHPSSEKRLRAIQEMAELGAGFRISQRDLDLRGAGDLFGEDQTGHMKLAGPALYRHLLQRALKEAMGEGLVDEFVPELRLEVAATIPCTHIQDSAVRLELYDRLAKTSTANEIDRLAEEVEDRFGTLPVPLENLFALAKLRATCRRAGISRVDAGHRAIAISFRPGKALRRQPLREFQHHWNGHRMIVDVPSRPDERIQIVDTIVHHLLGRG